MARGILGSHKLTKSGALPETVFMGERLTPCRIWTLM